MSKSNWRVRVQRSRLYDVLVTLLLVAMVIFDFIVAAHIIADKT